jgi:NADPH-ferrihemoprotein reductase
VFSLGNSTYEHYQAAGRYVDHRLEELGCIRQFIRGEGDDEGMYYIILQSSYFFENKS